MKRLRIFATRLPSGEVRDQWLLEDRGRLAYLDEASDGAALALPPGALPAVFARYGRALEEEVPAPCAEEVVIPVGPASRVRAFRFRGFGSVHPADYLALECDGADTLAAPSPLVAAALAALARASRGSS